MSVIFSTEELTAMDRAPVPIEDLGLVSLGHEFDADDLLDVEFDMSDLECHPLLASELPLNSELESLKDTSLKDTAQF